MEDAHNCLSVWTQNTQSTWASRTFLCNGGRKGSLEPSTGWREWFLVNSVNDVQRWINTVPPKAPEKVGTHWSHIRPANVSHLPRGFFSCGTRHSSYGASLLLSRPDTASYAWENDSGRHWLSPGPAWWEGQQSSSDKVPNARLIAWIGDREERLLPRERSCGPAYRCDSL